MAKPSKKTIEPLLKEYGELKLRRMQHEISAATELQPIQDAYNKKAAPVLFKLEEKTKRIDFRMKALAEDIEAQLRAGINEKKETVALGQVSVDLETSRAIAAVIAKQNDAAGATLRLSDDGKWLVAVLATVDGKPGDRVIDPKVLFDQVPKAKHNSVFWGCYKVLIAEAKKLLGDKAVNELATKPKKYSVSFSLKN
jgi:hypothetical protein